MSTIETKPSHAPLTALACLITVLATALWLTLCLLIVLAIWTVGPNSARYVMTAFWTFWLAVAFTAGACTAWVRVMK